MTSGRSNAEKGKVFASKVGAYLERTGYTVRPEYEVETSINSLLRKPHKFDWGNDTLLVECKAYSWAPSGSNPSAKFSTANEALLYFLATPKSYRKMLFMSETGKTGKRNPATLVEQYVRRYGHFIPDDVEIYELNESNLSANRVWPPHS